MKYTVSMEAARVNAKMSQRQAAEAIGVNVTTLSNWERGKTAPDVDKFKQLCALYNCPSNIVRLV